MHRSPHPKSPSLDQKLFSKFVIGAFLQVLLPLNGSFKLALTTLWAGFLIKCAIRHRQKHQWQWQGLTGFTLFKSLRILALGLINLAVCVAIGVYEFIDDQALTTINPIKTFPELIRILPDFFTSTSPVIIFCIVLFYGLIFRVMTDLRLAYLSEEDFLKDCNNENISITRPEIINHVSGLRQSKSPLKRLKDFFTVRAFVLQKHPNSIRIEFYKVSSQDLQANFSVPCMLLAFFLLSIYGAISTLVFGLASVLDNTVDLVRILALLLPGVYVVGFCTIFAYMIWHKILRVLLMKTAISFEANDLVVYDGLFSSWHQVFRVQRANLIPLTEQAKQTEIPDVKNAALMIQRNGKSVELAGHLLPEAMATVQQVYDSYRTTAFDKFYDQVQPIYLV